MYNGRIRIYVKTFESKQKGGTATNLVFSAVNNALVYLQVCVLKICVSFFN